MCAMALSTVYWKQSFRHLGVAFLVLGKCVFKKTLKLPQQHNQRMATRLEYTDLCQNYETLEGLWMPGPFLSYIL